MAPLKQYVNLKPWALFVERDITSLDRLGPVAFKVELKKDDPILIKFRTVLVSEKSPYTETEKTRNRWYKLLEPLGLGVNTSKELEASCVAVLPPAGGAVYRIEALADDKTVKSSDEVETWRRLFLQIFRMKDPSDPKKEVKVPKLKGSIDYYKKLFVELLDVPKDTVIDIPYRENAEHRDLIGFAKSKYTAKDREPWVLALVFSNALPSRDVLEIDGDISSGKVSLPGRWGGNEELEFDLPKNKYLWWGISPSEDSANGGRGVWLMGAGTLTVDGRDYSLPEGSIKIDTSKALRNGKGFSRLKISIPADARNQNRLFGKDATLRLRLMIVGGFSGGFAMRDENLLTVASTAWWYNQADSESEMLQVFNHELGHKLGMVPKGGRRFGGKNELDAPDKLYGDLDLIYAGTNPTQAVKDWIRANGNAKGHRGAHCERGVSAKRKRGDWEWCGSPACTMFGATSTDDGNRCPQNFCGTCEKLMIRQNLDPSDPDGVLSFKSILEA